MNVLGIGPWELLIILILAFLIFGPERLPEIARELGRAVREFRQMSQGMMETVSELQAELESASDSVTSSLMEVKGELEETSRELTTGLEEMVESVDQAAEEVKEVGSLEVDLDKLVQPSEAPRPGPPPQGQSSEVSEEPAPEPAPPSTPAELGVAEMEEEMPHTENLESSKEEVSPAEGLEIPEAEGDMPPTEEATISEHEG